MTEELKKAGRSALERENAGCVVIKDGEVVYKASGHGIKPLLDLLERSPGLLAGADAADRIVGKAAALLFVKGAAASVYGEVMSGAAYDVLVSNGVTAGWGTRAASISNRDGSGICPMERAVLNVDDPDEAFHVLKDTLKRLTGGG